MEEKSREETKKQQLAEEVRLAVADLESKLPTLNSYAEKLSGLENGEHLEAKAMILNLITKINGVVEGTTDGVIINSDTDQLKIMLGIISFLNASLKRHL